MTINFQRSFISFTVSVSISSPTIVSDADFKMSVVVQPPLAGNVHLLLCATYKANRAKLFIYALKRPSPCHLPFTGTLICPKCVFMVFGFCAQFDYIVRRCWGIWHSAPPPLYPVRVLKSVRYPFLVRWTCTCFTKSGSCPLTQLNKNL